MKSFITTIIFLMLSVLSIAQTIPENSNRTDAKGLRQGKWTLLFDAEWSPVVDRENAVFYRLIEYKSDKPIGLVSDHYPSGKKQWEGRLIQDRPEEIMEGEATWYREDGSLEMKKVFEKGKIVKETFYNPDGSESPENWAALKSKVRQAYNEHNYKKAVDLQEKAVIQAEKEFGKVHANYASALNDLAFMYKTSGDYKKPEALYLESKNIYEKLFGKENKDYALSVGNLAVLYDDLGQYEKAEEFYIESKNLNEKIFGKRSGRYASSLNNLAYMYASIGRYEKAELLYLESKDIREMLFGKADAEYAITLNNLAFLYNNMSLYEKAEPLFIEAKNVLEKAVGKEHPDYALALNSLALLYSNIGLYEKAEPLFMESLTIKAKTIGVTHPDYALALNNLAFMYKTMGIYKKAERMYIEAKSILERTYGKEDLSYATLVNNLAGLYGEMGLYKEAEVLYIESMKIRVEKLGKEHKDYAESLNNLAAIYDNMYLYDKALALYIESKSITEKVLGKDNPEYSLSLNNLGALYRNMGLLEKAEPLLVESLEIKGKMLGKEHPDYALALKNLGSLYNLMGRYEKTKVMYLEANRLLLGQIQRYFPSLSESEKDSFYAQAKSDFEYFNAFALASEKSMLTAEAYNMQLATKSLLFNTNNKVRQRILNSGNDSLIHLYLAWHRQRNKLVKAYQLTVEERTAKKVDLEKLEDEINQKEKQLSLQSEAFATATDNKQYTWQDVKKKLKRKEAAIELIRFKKYGISKTVIDSSRSDFLKYTLPGLTDTVYYAALIVTGNSMYPELILIKNGNDLEGRFLKNYKNNIKFKLNDTISYNRFWKPIVEVLIKRKIKKVYFSPDGVYNSINLSTFQIPNTTRYVTDEFDVRLVTNTKDLIIGKEKTKKSRIVNASFFGYPDYSGKDSTSVEVNEERALLLQFDDTQRFLDGGRITQLTGTQREIQTITKLLSDNQIMASEYLDRRATEEEVKKLSNPKILHIATHGFFLQDATITHERAFTGFDAKHVRKNPLFRSGLLLANSQKAIDGFRDPNLEDGILTAYEAMNLNLDGTDLVVLSACETGLGEIRNGEGVYGLQRAFQTAGAKSVLMSLWKVDDTATQELMTAFYKNWLKSGDKRDAFKKAQAALRKKYKHPYYWGAFVLVGE